MIVTFVSQCEKKALARTRRVLDAYANRIGDNVWQTIITEEGLLMVKKLLRRTATKNSAISCHWIRSRRRTDLLWIVGNRQKFNSEGHVPVNRTEKKLIVQDMENDWHYLPMIKSLTALSALLHDWGKCSDLFQEKLVKKADKFKGDPLRHEWISCLLLQSLINISGDQNTDQGWLDLLKSNQWDEKKLIKEMQNIFKNHQFNQLEILPPLAQMVSWIILSHHRMPDLRNKDDDNSMEGYDKYSDETLESITELFETIKVTWGYENNFDDGFKKRLSKCFKFSSGLLKESTEWISGIKRWSKKLLDCVPQTNEIMTNGSWRMIIQYSRLTLMLGDHYFSSLPKNFNSKTWRVSTELMANTDKKTGQVKQYLDEHLHGVYQHGLLASQYLKDLTFEMPYAHDLKKIKLKSPEGFTWQNTAVDEIKKFRARDEFNLEQGWFIVNLASTGTGKTIANAKVMQALSQDSNALRYILALGLRTLTLQTGDSYRENLGMAKEDLAVLIGSKAVQELHERNQTDKKHEETEINEEIGSESLEALLDDEIDFTEGQFYPEFMDVLFPKNDKAASEKNKAFLYHPILVCTIDHIMGATETTRGGKYLLPYLRLLSSDLVIDEVDDFSVEDLIPIARLVHLAGMLGRKVMISSATIPPSLAGGLFNAYQKGFTLFANFRKLQKTSVNAMWLDEFSTKITQIELSSEQFQLEQYRKLHVAYIDQRANKLLEKVVKQRAKIVQCEYLQSEKETHNNEALQTQYFELIKENIKFLHSAHHAIDPISGKKISFGVVRVANIQPCVELTHYLLNAEWGSDFSPRVMAYHSRQILLLRSVQERHLDAVLSRKETSNELPKALNDPIIRQHIDNAKTDNIGFVLVATPVEEVGRDHDFDWAVIEPSSYRSIIQLAGRVLRHRKREHNITEPNIALMQFNLKGLHNKDVAFNRPGFESQGKRFKLSTKNLSNLIDHDDQHLNINAIPRIKENSDLQSNHKLADLEHVRIRYYLMNDSEIGPQSLNGWLDETWFLTGLPQRFHRFRNSAEDIQLFAVYKDDDIDFCERNEEGDWISRGAYYDIKKFDLSEIEVQKLWLHRDYYQSLCECIDNQLTINIDESILIEKASKRYGEIMIPQSNNQVEYFYSDQLGLFKNI